MRTWKIAAAFFSSSFAYSATANAQITQFDNPLASQGLQIPDSGARAWERAGTTDNRTFQSIGDESDGLLLGFSRRAEKRQITNANDALAQEDEIVLGDGPGSWKEAKAAGMPAGDYIHNEVEPALDEIGATITNDGAREHFSEQRRAMLMDYIRRLSVDKPEIVGSHPFSAASTNASSAASSFQSFDEWKKNNAK